MWGTLGYWKVPWSGSQIFVLALKQWISGFTSLSLSFLACTVRSSQHMKACEVPIKWLWSWYCHDSVRAPTPKQSQILCHSGGGFTALGILPRLSGENGPGETHTFRHLFAGSDIKAHPRQVNRASSAYLHQCSYFFWRMPWAACKFSAELISVSWTHDHPKSLSQKAPTPSSIPSQT